MKYLKFEGSENKNFDCNLNFLYYNQEYLNKELIINDNYNLILKNRVDWGFKQAKLNSKSPDFDDLMDNLELSEVIEQLKSYINSYPIVNSKFNELAFVDALDIQVNDIKLINVLVDDDYQIRQFEIVFKYFSKNVDTSELKIVRNILFNLVKEDDYTLALFQKMINASKKGFDNEHFKVVKTAYSKDDKFKSTTVKLIFYF